MNMTEVAQAIRGGLIQQNRLLKTSIPALPENALVPRRAVTRSELGRDFSVTLDMVSTAGDIELKTLIAQPMTLWIQQADRSYLPINGYIHTSRRLGADGSLSSYQLAFASWMHFLKFRSDMRYWQDTSVDAVITDVFNAHPQARGQFEFALRKPLPSRSYCRQSETDWNFVHRLMEEEGLFGFWRQGQDGRSHRLVVTDDIYSLDEMSPHSVRFSRSGTGSETNAFTQWAGSRTLQSTVHTTRTFDYKAPSSLVNPKGTTLPTMSGQGDLPEQAEVYEYTGAYTYPDRNRGEHLSKMHLEEWESRAKRFLGVGGVRAVDAGYRFVLTGHPEHDRDSTGQREFAAIKVHRYIENNLPLSNHEANFPYSLQVELAQARLGQAGGTVMHEDGSAGFYRVEVEAQRVTVPYRSPFEHRKPAMELETAIVVGPQGEEVYTDALNRVKVMFVWDRQNAGDASASCWVRVAQSDTGGGYGSVHVPRVGEEVLIGYIGGDCDRPIVLHRVYNGNVQPQWHSNGLLSGYRSKEYSGSGYNEMVLDDATGQNRLKLYSSTANSLLHLGYLIDQSSNARGSYLGTGFDLKSDAYGAIRAGQGLYVSSYSTSVDQPLDVRQAAGQLSNAQTLVKSLSDASISHQAEGLAPGHDSLREFSDATQSNVAGSAAGGRTAGGGMGNANSFKTPIMLMASPAGIGMSTRQSTQIAADQHVNVVSGENVHLAAGQSLVASVREKISLFAKSAGMKLFAAKGKVEIQAQSDNLELIADQVLKLISAKKSIEITAAEEILLQAKGSYIRINGAGIEQGTPANWIAHAASHALPGPKSLPAFIPGMDMPKAFSNRLDVYDIYWPRSFEEVEYTARRASGEILTQGMLDQEGRTARLSTDQAETIQVLVGTQGSWLVETEGDANHHDSSGDVLPEDPYHYVHHSA
ncbi:MULTISPECIES: type VI secretion system Vgr family protein [unclassified Burkholderia]|uniref:type VI secretion system Vgr family protein n=1 Tax=unclassified Burkholderia TaxID=2613784 RepID=UPI00141F839E|nr:MULTISPECIES: type VI secretion system Vgr family protein [unclassified Burkholderia]NIE57344.1 type VI secretion system tip protein VgrG [Burkholderia sp. Ap-955]NIF08070.1 type VI secretion system tip protein VgrG [Burkholderia sp. Ax-1735]NIG02074.1 type VI secretion system tip protein VgrG [Burkholderia sp. Tr-849]